MDLVNPYSYFQVTKEFHLEFETFFVNFLSLKEIIFINFFYFSASEEVVVGGEIAIANEEVVITNNVDLAIEGESAFFQSFKTNFILKHNSDK